MTEIKNLTHDCPNFASKEIILEWSYPDKGDIDLGKNLFGEVLNGILELFGVQIKNGLAPNNYLVHFRDIDAFRFIFNQNWTELSRENTSKPYRIQMLMEKWPDEVEVRDLYSITQKYFKKLNVPFENINGSSMIEATFPSQAAYLANMIEFFQLVGLGV